MPRESLASLQPPALPTGSTDLKLPLRRALECLSVDLETELVRYRQSRQGTSAAPAPRGLAFRRRRKPIDLIRVESQPSQESAAASAATANAPNRPLPPPLPPNPKLVGGGSASVGTSLAQQELAQQEIDLVNAQSASAQLEPSAAGELSSGGAEAGTGEVALTPYQAIPEDYLETTEALLRSAAEDPFSRSDDTTYSPSLARRLATPLGMGALLLLLISSASLGYLLTNPRAIGHLWNHPALLALRGQSPAGEEAAAGGTFEPGLDGLGPDLSEQEFVDLNLSTLSTLPTTSAVPTPPSTPLTMVGPSTLPGPSGAASVPTAPGSSGAANPTAAAPAPAAPSAPSRPPSTVPATVRPVQAPAAPAPARSAAPAPANAAPAPASTSTRPAAPTPASPAPVTTAPPPLPAPPQAAAPSGASAGSSYYVVTDYTGDQSLSNARSAVDEAYVRNFPAGARIQMGAFEQESSARELVQELQEQGIPAEVYQP